MNTRQVLVTSGAVIAALAAGWWGRGLLSEPTSMDTSVPASAAAGPCPDGQAPLYWKAPMDPSYVRDTPGKSPMGMDLVPECPGDVADVPEGAVVVDAATIQNIGVRTTSVERRDLARSVRAGGRVAYDERRVAHVHTKVQGWVERLFIDFVGQEVKRGEPLLEIYSPELVATQEELLLAARYRDATGESPFEDVRGGGEALFEATKRRLALWDIPERDIERLLRTGNVKRTLTLYAPASGVVTELGVRSGMEVKPNSNLYTIADLSKVWVLADVYEYELPWLALGQEAKVEISYLPGEAMQGALTYIAPFLDPKTRTAEIRLELDNTSGKLKPEMFGNVVIAGTPHPDALAVPSEAVLRSGTRTIAVVALGEGRFEPRDIELGLDTGEGILEVRTGLREGERVVVSSQFLIDSESNLQEAVRKLLAARSEKGGSAPPDRTAHGEHEASRETAPAMHEGHDSLEAAPMHEHHGTPTEEE
jgi:Cu(I)/Ag(I) efflux system membrane fusion protein/cobalt-zinc-cadmium efflux system membrane fusion protein